MQLRRPQNGEYTGSDEVGSEVARLSGLLEMLLVQETEATKRLLQLEQGLAELKMRGKREDASQHYLGFMEVKEKRFIKDLVNKPFQVGCELTRMPCGCHNGFCQSTGRTQTSQVKFILLMSIECLNRSR